MNSKSPTDPAPAEPDPESSVFETEHLDNWPFKGTSLAVLGHPVKHSISPPMHNAALKRMAETDPAFADWRYFKFHVPPGRLPETLSLLHAKRFRGVNLTLPHKTDALPLLTRIDPVAERMGAVNTLVWTADGYEGFNSDGYGLSTAVEEQLGAGLSSQPVILLGAGGAARAAAVQCILDMCPELWLGNRNQDRLKALYRDLLSIRKESSTRLEAFDLSAPPDNLPAPALIINATSAGLAPDSPSPLDLSALKGAFSVYEMIYNPPETALMKEARLRGMRAANGLSMLVHQGVRSLEIWSGAAVPVDAMRTAAENALAT